MLTLKEGRTMRLRAFLQKTLTGKRYLLLVCAVLLAASVAPAQTEYSEAPLLAERVAAGELPPLGERLPANPMVVTPVERVGTYGGTWNTTIKGAADAFWLRKLGPLEARGHFVCGI